MDVKRAKQGFIKFIRIYPFIAVGLLVLAYLVGGFSQTTKPLVPRAIVMGLFYVLIGVIPVMITIIFVAIGISEDRSRARNLKNPNNFGQEDPFNLAHEEMCGFKVVGLSGENPTFTGITGDTYKKMTAPYVNSSQSMFRRPTVVNVVSMPLKNAVMPSLNYPSILVFS